MCKLAFSKTKNGTAYRKAVAMIKHQENVVAGHSTGIAWKDNQGVHVRKAIGKIINFIAKYPDIPNTNMALGHSRFASVGEINLENQHPIKIFYHGKRIGYGIHNGTWMDYYKYEYMRNPNLVNKTDSALLFTIYGDILDKYGNTRINRIRALATMGRIATSSYSYSPGFDDNFIIMFDDGQVIFGGWELTYKSSEDKVGIMTFGLPNKVDSDSVYEVAGFNINKYKFNDFRNYVLKPKEQWYQDTETELTCSTERCSKIIRLEGKSWKLVSNNFKTRPAAKLYAEMTKDRYGINYRVLRNRNGRWSLYTEYTKNGSNLACTY